MKKQGNNNLGFTLVEILVVAAFLGFVMGGIFAVLNLGAKSIDLGLGLVDLQQQGRRIMDSMVREVRQASTSGMTIGAAGSRVNFHIPDASGVISYYISGDNIIREYPAGTTKVLAGEITNLDFCCLHNGVCDGDCSEVAALQIYVRAEKLIRNAPQSFSLTEKVKLRNK